MGRAARPIYSLGTVCLILLAGVLHAASFSSVRYALVGSAAGYWLAVFAVAQLAIGYALGLPDLAHSRTDAAARGLLATVAAFVVISACQAVLATPLLPRSSSVLIGCVLPLWSVVAWNLSVDVTSRAATRDRVFLVAERAEDHHSLELDLSVGAESPASLVGVATLDDLRRGGTSWSLQRAAVDVGANIVVLDTASQANGPVVEDAAALHRAGVRIRTLSLFYEEWIGKLPHAELARVSLLFDIGELHRARYVRAKRAVDLCYALAGAAFLIPVAAVVGIINPFFNPGPLVYRQRRVGRNNEEFIMYKFRTMRETGPHEEGRSDWTATDDARITPFGRFLRRTHLDELPQVMNILRGDLSLIGPRPEQPGYVTELSDKIAFYDVRHIVRPGLTGWAQVKQGYAADHADAFEKLQYDFYYLRRQGLTLDAKILRRTVRQVLQGAGR